MSYELHTDVNTLASRLTAGLQDALKRAIREKLQAQADEILDRVAEDMARSLHGIVHSYRALEDDEIHVQLVLDGVSKAVAAAKDIK